MYADDLLFISTTKEGLQYQIDSVHEYCGNYPSTLKKINLMVYNEGTI